MNKNNKLKVHLTKSDILNLSMIKENLLTKIDKVE
jgi:hypothetical protein